MQRSLGVGEVGGSNPLSPTKWLSLENQVVSEKVLRVGVSGGTIAGTKMILIDWSTGDLRAQIDHDFIELKEFLNNRQNVRQARAKTDQWCRELQDRKRDDRW